MEASPILMSFKKHLPKAERSPITRTNRGVRLSERLQRHPGTSTPMFSEWFSEEFRSDKCHGVVAIQPLNDECDIPALQSVVTCCRNAFSSVNHG